MIVVQHLHHYVFGRKVMIHTDHLPLVNIFQKCVNDTYPCLQHLLLRLTQYQMNVIYVTQKCVPMANCLSHLVDAKMGKEDPSLNLQIADVRLDQMPIDWNQVKKSYLNDPTMVKLARIIQWGWLESSRVLPDEIKVYFPYRFQLQIVNGIIFLQDRIMVPVGLRDEFLRRIHDVHLGIVKSKLLARTLIYWPNWNVDVTNMCHECTTCRENQAMPNNIPKYKVSASHVDEVFGIDVANIKGKTHLVIVDYKSCCIFECPLSTLHTSEIVNALKSVFCDVGLQTK